ncbi:neprilysin-11-like [Planococcus citri]|uniref:neprilysin-11-like n=1 Tax=Planococcus citri TaxID=170843 RepID=UPI0031F994FF
MLIPALLLNLAVVTMFLTTISYSGLIIWRESKDSHNTITDRPTTKPTRPTMSTPTRPGPTISPPTRPGPTISPPTRPGPTTSPPTRPGPTISPPPPGPTTNPPTRPGPTPPPGPTISPPPPTPPPNSTTLFPTPSSPKPGPENVCETEACKYADSVLNRKVRRALMPCNDFYYFACGKMESTESDKLEADTVLTKAIIEEKYHDILRKPETAEDIEPVKLAKQMYRKCNGNNSADTDQLGKMILTMRGLHESADSGSLLKSFYDIALKHGYLPRSLFIIDAATNNESQTILLIRNPSPPSGFYVWPLDNTSLRADTEELGNVVKKGEFAFLYEDVNGSISEEKKIAEAYSGYKPDFREFMFTALASEIGPPLGSTLADIIHKMLAPFIFPSDLKVRVECIGCLHYVWAMNFENNKTLLLRHLIRHALADNILDTPEKGVEEWFKEQAGSPELIEYFKNKFCASKIVSLFKKAMDYEYIRNYVDPRKKDLIAKIIDQSKTSLKTLVKEAKHLDESAKDTYFRTIDSLKYYTPLDRAITDSADDIINFYIGFYVDPVSYGVSLKNVKRLAIGGTTIRLFKPHAIPIQAYKFMFGEKYMHYDADLNSVYLSVAALQDIFLSMDRSEFLNFGGFGSIIGHALSQSVDSKGSKQAEQMSLIQSVYLGIPMDTDKNGDNATECFVNSLKKHGNLTADEINQLNKKKQKAIVYESDGVQIAYHAYMNVRADLKDHQDQVLPSFVNYSDGAMFFLSYASMACSTDALLTNEKDNIRAYGKVNVVAKTSVDFDREFGCEVLQNEKCNLWLEGSSKKDKLNEIHDLFMR